MHKIEGDSDSFETSLGCEGCNKVTRHLVVEESYDATTKKHQMIKVCQRCDLCGHLEVTPAELEVIQEDNLYD